MKKIVFTLAALMSMTFAFAEEASNSKANAENVDTFVNLIKDFSLIAELNSAILNTLIEKIVVHEAEVIDGEKVQKIEIYYKFVGRI